MTKCKLCGLMSREDIETANRLRPEYIGFVFWPKSSRYITPEHAAGLKGRLSPSIRAVGVFVDEEPEAVASLLREGIIDLAQLHGNEDEAYLKKLRSLTDRPLIKAFRITGEADVKTARESSADLILLDAGMGGGKTFDWSVLSEVSRPYFLAGGLNPENAAEAAARLRPYALDVSSGIETDGRKDPEKMAAFVRAVRSAG